MPKNYAGRGWLAVHVTQPADIDPAHPDSLGLSLAKTLVRVLRDSDDPEKLIDAESWARRLAAAQARTGQDF